MKVHSTSILRPGDIVAVDRKILGMQLYQHYAVYIGNNKVIHYAANGMNSDFGDATIHEAPFEEFLKNSSEFHRVDLSKSDSRPDQSRLCKLLKSITSKKYISKFILKHLSYDFPIRNRIGKYHLYSPEETIKRARSRIGERDYSLIRNNCEHFAVWCKTGVKESFQVLDALSTMPPGPLNIV